MKKFSTAAFVLAFASHSFAASNDEATTSPRCAFLPTAPDQHVVVRGDTLWGISGKFLQHPWCWPQVWGMNREAIRNPHWIYPGQIVYLDRAAGRLRLGTPIGSAAPAGETGGGMPSVRLAPRVRAEQLVGQQAVPTIPSNAIEPFLSQPLVVTENELTGLPRIVAAPEGRVVIGKNDKAYVVGDLKAGTAFQVFRPATPLKDPVTRAVIGYEAAYLGNVKLVRKARSADEAHVFDVVSVKQEMTAGDRLMPVPPTPVLNYVPHAPEKPVDAHIVSIYDGMSQAGQNQIVSINRGIADGVDPGTVLDLYRLGAVVSDRTDPAAGAFSKKQVKLPDTRYGALFVFRTFEHISYGLVMQVRESVQVGDIAKSPEQAED